MSFTPDTPIGFDPCGYAFGAVRKPYSADCKFFSDSAWGENRINWYIVPDDTPDYPGPTTFWPRVDTPADEAESLNEREGPGRWVRRFSWDLMFAPPPPHDVHGDEQDFTGESPKSKYFIGGEEPDPPCGVIGVHPVRLRLRVRVRPAPFLDDAGLCFGAACFPPPPSLLLTAGLRLGAEHVASVPTYTAGLALGATLEAPPPLPPLDAGLLLGADVLAPDVDALTVGLRFGAAEPMEVPTCGLLLGAEIVAFFLTEGGVLIGADLVYPAELYTHDAGLQIGADIEPAPPIDTPGLELGAELAALDYVSDAGLQLGAELIVAYPPPSSGGVLFGGEVIDGP